jgi:hypothetical protein
MRALISRIAALGIVGTALTGCVSTNTVPLAGRDGGSGAVVAMAGRTIAPVSRATPDFAAMTAGKATLGLIGTAAMISTGNDIVQKNGVADPAVAIRDALLAEFAARQGLSVTAAGGSPIGAMTTDVKKIIAGSPKADLLLDAQTINWSFAYFPADWNSYRVIYSVKVRLIDTQAGKTIAEGFCQRFPDKTPDAPSRDQLLENQAARLKEQLNVHGGQCLTELQAKVFAPGAPLGAGR